MEKEIKRFKQVRITYWIVGPILLLESIWFAMSWQDASTLQGQMHHAFWAMWIFLQFVVLAVWYAGARNALEIRKDIKELTLAIKELKEKMGK